MTKKRLEAVHYDLSQLALAETVQVVWCEDPECLNAHLVLYDENDKPFAMALNSRDCMEDIAGALYQKAAMQE